ncbi:MAG TPA: hypothetical protein VFK02_23545 [Kofleriaceae bacterium]|nr:hypothetical protein [Kofleriaceae bacterium]
MMKTALIASVAAFVGVMGLPGCKQGAAPASAGSGAGSGSTGAAASTAPAPAAAPQAKPAAPATPPSAGKPLREALADTASGQPVLLALDARGQLIARTLDGATTTLLLPGPYDDAIHDAPLDLVWLRRDTGVDVLDLRLPGPPAAKQLVSSPDKVIEKLGDHFSEPPHWDMTRGVFITVGTTCSHGAGIVLDWSKGGAATTTGAEGVKVIARDWFAAQEHRTRRDVPPAFTRKLKPRKVPRDVGTCRTDVKEELGKDECGHGLAFGATSYDLVIVSANSEKCPAKQCRRYDSATKKYTPVPGVAADEPELATCGPFLFDGTGTSYLVDDQLCTGETCTSVGRQAIGWLDGARVLDAS